MPLPLLIAIPALVGMAGYGVKKSADAVRDNKKANVTRKQTAQIYANANKNLKQARESTTASLVCLGKLKLALWEDEFGCFVTAFEKLKNVQLTNSSHVDRLGAVSFTKNDLAEMKKISNHAKEVATGGAAAVSTGALVGMASYGGATMFAAASTGTAIGSLSGAAAANATLAWFGGGSLATGGLGMAGGTAVLGGIVAAPVLAVGGAIFAAKARQNLAEAKADKAKAKKAAAQLRSATALVNGIKKVSEQYIDLLEELRPKFNSAILKLERVIEDQGSNYEEYDTASRQAVYFAVQFTTCMKAIIEAPILNKSGALHKQHQLGLTTGRQFIEQSI